MGEEKLEDERCRKCRAGNSAINAGSSEPVARERFLSVYGAAIAVQWFEHVRAGGRLDDDEIRRFIFDARALAEWTEDVQR
jgi:hypothetical protein